MPANNTIDSMMSSYDGEGDSLEEYDASPGHSPVKP